MSFAAPEGIHEYEDKGHEYEDEGFSLKKLLRDKKDALDREIDKIYAYRQKRYAIYKVKDSDVYVQFSDDKDEEKRQIIDLDRINPDREAINCLVKGYDKREYYDRQIAGALQMALDGQTIGAEKRMYEIKQNFLSSRAVKARLKYLLFLFVFFVIVMISIFVLKNLSSYFTSDLNGLWLAVRGGLVGAFFSIVLAIRTRTIVLDDDWKSNAIDAGLRMAIGVISSGALYLLFTSGAIPKISVGDASVSNSNNSWQALVLLGFVAGFFERMVPDLLERKGSPPVATTPPIRG